MKKRLAIWMFGGIGTGHFDQGQPTHEKILNGLSENFELVVYSRHAPNAGYHSSYFKIRTAPAWIAINFFRWVYLIGMFIPDYFRKKFDIVFSFWGYPSGFIVVLMGKIFRIPSIVYLLGADSVGIASIRYGILLNSFHRALAFWGYQRATHLLALTNFQRDQLKKYGFDHPMKIIPFGIDLSMFPFKQFKKRSPLQIIHVGHLAPVKDQGTLLQAFSLIIRQQPAHLKILGGDDLNGELQKKAINLGIAEYVEFIGVVPFHEMPYHYSQADIMMHTSLSEGQCVALTEAAASGILIAGTKVGLLYDLNDDFAIRVEVGDYQTLADKVLGAIADSSGWEKKIVNSRNWSEIHDLKWTIRSLNELILNLKKG